MKSICKDCGWEIKSPNWWNKLDKDSWLCDDCDTDQAIKTAKIQGVLL
jgi:hypothetical protein